MRRKRLEEHGAEIIELCFALPLLMLAFLVTAQIIIWAFSAAQFTSAAEATASQIDLTIISEDPELACAVVSSDIAGRMLCADVSNISVREVTVTSLDDKRSDVIGGASHDPASLTYSVSQTTGRISFVAEYTCPQVINIGDPLVITHTWNRDRLLSRTAEVF